MTTLEDQTLDKEIEEEPAKTLAYYEANPDEMPEDIDSINEIEDTDAKPIKVDDKDAGDDKDKDKDNQDKADKGSVDDDSDKLPIETKDGKHTMPYSVLENTRNELNTTKGRVQELEAELDGFKTKAQEAADAEKDLHDGKDAPLTAEGELDIEKLREEYDDDVVDTMVAMHKQTQAALKKFDDLSEKFESVISKSQQSDEQSAANSVQDAIDNIPFVADLQSKGGDDWDTAVAIDKSLRMNPLWAEKSYEERFKEVARQMGDESQATTDDGDLDDKVNDALRKAKGKAPTSISDLDGGENIDVDGIESGANLSETQMEARIENMSPDQLDKWLATG